MCSQPHLVSTTLKWNVLWLCVILKWFVWRSILAGGVWVFNAQGKLLGVVALNVPTSNCLLLNGYLYITTGAWLMGLCAVGFVPS